MFGHVVLCVCLQLRGSSTPSFTCLGSRVPLAVFTTADFSSLKTVYVSFLSTFHSGIYMLL